MRHSCACLVDIRLKGESSSTTQHYTLHAHLTSEKTSMYRNLMTPTELKASFYIMQFQLQEILWYMDMCSTSHLTCDSRIFFGFLSSSKPNYILVSNYICIQGRMMIVEECGGTCPQ